MPFFAEIVIRAAAPLALAAAAATALGGCGQTGPLYLPDATAPSPAATPPVQTPAPAPAPAAPVGS
ncbi:hypothetical protein EBQ26_06650 [Allofranklinella schreckenbergeri]|uniref:Lipoprotein n=1 Tax=Allofranklinella schreckenbergeri TaxID=1076744 RepID=A0A3M6Q6C9_9BURK|nr:lipoprotein [Allofranklinella schreckenbergeri]RMW98526.1 hypothetical protein EBQ26_06650 [Allofranklinella schreckenbergeri]